MGKKKSTNKPQKKKDTYFFFVKDQGEGAAKVAVIVLKLAEIALTTIFALCLGIFAPIIIWTGEDAEIVAGNPALILWFASSILYIIGMFVVMLGHSKSAAAIHIAAALGTLLTYSSFKKMFEEIPNTYGPSGLYMPCLFITILTVIIMFLINFPKWLDKQIEQENAVAPSILGGEYTIKNPVGRKSGNNQSNKKRNQKNKR
ncbi:MAG: hypothetical protein ACI4JS_07320 [Oscillospiraceae bacterium]